MPADRLYLDSIMADSASVSMRAVELTGRSIFEGIDVDIIRGVLDPWKAPASVLTALALELSVDIWNEDWTDTKKRSVLASAKRDHQLKGTLEGIRRYVDIMDGEILQVLTHPQAFFAAPDLTKEQWDEWIGRMPRLRITVGHGTGEWNPPVGFFADLCFSDVDHVWINEGPALYGRRAFLRTSEDGEDIPLQLSTVIREDGTREGVVEERVVVPGLDANAIIADDGAADVSFVDAESVNPKFYSFALHRDYAHSESRLSLTTVPIGLEPIDTRYYRISDIGDAGPWFFSDDGAADADVFVGENDGGELLADVLFLHDPTVLTPIVQSISFADVSRVGMDPYRAEMMIDVPHFIPAMLYAIAGDGFVGEVAAPDNDQSHLEQVLDAVDMSKSLRDKVLVTFQTTRERPIGLGIPLDGSARLDDRIPNHL